MKVKEEEQEYQFEFFTEYVSRGKIYGDSIFARTKQEAETILRDKKLTERVVGYDPEKPLSID